MMIVNKNINILKIMEDLCFWQLKFAPCFYSNRLLEKLVLLNERALKEADVSEITKAIFYSKKYHGEQRRQSGEPYYSHPLEVAYMVSDYLSRTNIIVTCILHDTIEDTKLTFENIQEIFGMVIADQVMDLTRIKGNGIKISSAEMVESLWLQKKYDILLIKQFDRLHNIRTIGAKSPEKIKKIMEETINTFLILAAYLGIPEQQEELRQMCSKIIAPDKDYLLNKKTLIMGNYRLPALNSENGISQMKNQKSLVS